MKNLNLWLGQIFIWNNENFKFLITPSQKIYRISAFIVITLKVLNELSVINYAKQISGFISSTKFV